ncbi:MAG: cytidylate kinase family protein, partial [Blautia sp.]
MACHIVLSESGKDVLCMAKSIITIGRQYGSGGREIGEKVAERLG